jgi:tetratricopeptide (TPR) repeat protein
MVVPDDLDGLAKAGRAAKVNGHRACLTEALTRFEAASRDDTRVEASVRAGWILVQAGRFKDALSRLDVEPAADRDLAFWLALFRGRALDALGRVADSAAEYRSALALVPDAQSAGIGLVLALGRLDRPVEADERARALRAAGAAGVDPWSFYINGDERFVDDWIKQLRDVVR